MNLKNEGISGEIPNQKKIKKELVRSEVNLLTHSLFSILQQNYKN